MNTPDHDSPDMQPTEVKRSPPENNTEEDAQRLILGDLRTKFFTEHPFGLIDGESDEVGFPQ